MSDRVAIVGAGLAGLTCARLLVAAGREVTVFDKGRGPGGRLATRRGEHGSFDHGAPVLHGVDGATVVALRGAPVVAAAPWRDGAVGVPRMSAVGRALAAGLDVRLGERVAALADLDAAVVVVTAPAPQAAELLEPEAPALAARAREAVYDPCWTVMAAFGARLGLDDVVQGRGPVQWAAREGAKPGRDADPERWVVQATPAWSRDALEDDPADVGPRLLAALTDAAPVHLAAHRWRFATVARPLDGILREGRLLAGGDWTAGRRAGDAVRAGHDLARAVLDA